MLEYGGLRLHPGDCAVVTIMFAERLETYLFVKRVKAVFGDLTLELRAAAIFLRL